MDDVAGCWVLGAGLAMYRLRLRTSIRPRLYPLFIVYHTMLLNGLPVSHRPGTQSDVVGANNHKDKQ